MTKIALVWFKSDLRLHDNETLIRAIEENDLVIPVYCFDSSHFKKNEFGFDKTGSFRANFLLESVTDLQKNLNHIGSDLYVLKGNPLEEIPALVKKYGVRKVYAKREVTYFEKETDIALERSLWEHKCLFENYSTSTLYLATDLPFSINNLPVTFTSYRKKIEVEADIRTVFETPENIKTPKLPPQKIPTLEDLGIKDKIKDKRSAFHFLGGENEAIKRLKYYLFESKLLSKYKETRNGMIGSDYSSKLSPWLACGCISTRFIYAEVKKYEQEFGANESTYWLIFELIWRDYFRFVFKKEGVKLFQYNGISKNQNTPPKINHSIINKWISGQTGNDFIDANMNELRLTGFMSNRGRQNVASYFIHELQQDWRVGASYFEQELIDYDVTSNWGNWAYLAGVGNDPRSGRKFKVEKQAKEYDPTETYRKMWLLKH